MANSNRVILTGNLTSDPELSSLPSGTSVCKLRLAVNRRYKDQASGEWVEKPNYFDIKVWGAQGDNCANYLAKRRAVEVVADTVQFLGSRDAGEGGGQGGQARSFEPRGGELKPDPVPAFGGS